MDEVVYVLCGITSAACGALLLRGYLKTKMRLLLWSTICFFCITLANILVYIDLVMFPAIDLVALRDSLTFIGLSALIFGMIQETV